KYLKKSNGRFDAEFARRRDQLRERRRVAGRPFCDRRDSRCDERWSMVSKDEPAILEPHQATFDGEWTFANNPEPAGCKFENLHESINHVFNAKALSGMPSRPGGPQGRLLSPIIPYSGKSKKLP